MFPAYKQKDGIFEYRFFFSYWNFWLSSSELIYPLFTLFLKAYTV